MGGTFQSRLQFTFAAPVTHVYNPLEYAWRAHSAFVTRYGNSTKRVLFLGMNPGPFGMAQTGVPFGEIPAVRDWMGINESVDRPAGEHPKRPIEGFACRMAIRQNAVGPTEPYHAATFVGSFSSM